jgi:hypothetical protein
VQLEAVLLGVNRLTLGAPQEVCVQLEAVLLGHEDRVHCIRWRRAAVEASEGS